MEERITEFPHTAEGLALLVKELRKPYGCPWDKKQTIESLRPSLTGECAEVVEAADEHCFYGGGGRRRKGFYLGRCMQMCDRKNGTPPRTRFRQ